MIKTAIVTVSDKGSAGERVDESGSVIREMIEAMDASVSAYTVIPDEQELIAATLINLSEKGDINLILTTGGTGVAPRDVTPEAIRPLLDRELPGFGELFRMVSYEEIGAAALLSRALAGLHGDRVVFALPGSRGAIRTALEKLVLPELGHLVGEGGKGHSTA